MLSNKEKVVALQRSIATRDPTPLSYIHPQRYKQHNLGVGDGLAPILELHAALPVDTTVARPLRAIQDGDLVAVHIEYDLWGPKVGFDIHRFEDGLIVEHWDNLEELRPGTNASGHTVIGGATEVRDLTKTLQNKALVQRFVDEVLIRRRQETVAAFFEADELLQHHPETEDGGWAFAHLAGMDEGAGVRRYEECHLLLGEGNFVLSVCEGRRQGVASAFYDLFRVENGYLAEHWDVVEEIPDRPLWKNENGKF